MEDSSYLYGVNIQQSENNGKITMAETRGKNKNLIEAGNPRLLRKPVKQGKEYSIHPQKGDPFALCYGKSENRR